MWRQRSNDRIGRSRKYKIKKFDNIDLEANPRLALDASAKFLKGAGVVL